MSLPRGLFQRELSARQPGCTLWLWHRDEMALPAVIEPCLPSPGEQPPTGPDWVHEIKHDGYRLMARRDPVSVGIRLLTRNGHDWASRYPLIVQAVNKLKARSCLIDGEAVCCNEHGMPSFEKLRHRSNDQDVVLVAFDLLELDGNDLRREPLEVRKQTLASLLRGSLPGVQFKRISRIAATSCSRTPARWGLRASCRSGWAHATAPAATSDWLKFKNPAAPRRSMPRPSSRMVSACSRSPSHDVGRGAESSRFTQRASGSANTYIALWPRTGLSALTTPSSPAVPD